MKSFLNLSKRELVLLSLTLLALLSSIFAQGLVPALWFLFGSSVMSGIFSAIIGLFFWSSFEKVVRKVFFVALLISQLSPVALILQNS